MRFFVSRSLSIGLRNIPTSDQPRRTLDCIDIDQQAAGMDAAHSTRTPVTDVLEPGKSMDANDARCPARVLRDGVSGHGRNVAHHTAALSLRGANGARPRRRLICGRVKPSDKLCVVAACLKAS